MAVASMRMLNISGPVSMFPAAARLTGSSGVFQPENALSFYKTNESLTPMAPDNPWETAAQGLRGALPEGESFAADAKPADAESEEEKTALLSEAEQFISRMGEISRMREEKERSLEEKNERAEMMSHFVGLSIDMKEVSALEFTSVRFGRLPSNFFSRIDERDRKGQILALKCTEDRVYTYIVTFSPKSFSKEMDRILSGLHFERIFVPETDTTVESRLELLHDDIGKTRRSIDDLKLEADRLWQEKRDRISSVYKTVCSESVYADMRKYAAVDDDCFILAGWVPEKDGRELVGELSSLDGVEVTEEDLAGDGVADPPVMLKNRRLVKPFEMFVDMYGMPSYGESDPTPFVALTYILLFGIMFGDLGQGLLVSLAGFIMWKAAKMSIGPILMRCGISSAVFGCVFGSVFGFEHALDPVYKKLFGWNEKPIEVMDSKTTNMIIYAAVGIGIVLVAAAMLINIYSCAKRRMLEPLLFGENGIPGLVLYCSAAAALAGQLVFGIKLVSVPYIIFLIVLPLILIFLKEPLGMLVTGKKEKIEWGNYFAQSFFELFETVLSYVTNTMSFLRVGAFVLVHAGMMMVVFTLAEMSSGIGYAVIVIVGNIIVSALEGLLVAIQVLRLEFYEMFSRFFDGGGRPFVPAGKSDNKQ